MYRDIILLRGIPPLGTLDLGSEDLKRDLKEARRFVDHMFPGERLGR